MVILLLALDLFFLFFASFDVPSSSIIALAGGPVTSSLTRAFLIGITFGSLIFSFPLASSWITLTALSSFTSGKGGIAAVACGCLNI